MPEPVLILPKTLEALEAILYVMEMAHGHDSTGDRDGSEPAHTAAQIVHELLAYEAVTAAALDDEIRPFVKHLRSLVWQPPTTPISG